MPARIFFLVDGIVQPKCSITCCLNVSATGDKNLPSIQAMLITRWHFGQLMRIFELSGRVRVVRWTIALRLCDMLSL